MPETPSSPVRLLLGRTWGKLPAELRSKLSWISVLYFAEGFPFGVVYESLQVYFRQHGVDLRTLGLFSFLRLPYTVKPAWAPLVDRLGSRQAWVCASQTLLAAAFLALLVLDPAHPGAATWTVLILFAVLSATQDIAIDAYAVDVSTERDIGPINGFRVAFHRAGTLAAGGGLTFLASPRLLGWNGAWILGAGVSLALAALAWFAPRPTRQPHPRAHGEGASRRALTYRFVSLALLAFTAFTAHQQDWPGRWITLTALAAALALASFLSEEMMRWAFRLEMLPVLGFALLYKVGDTALGQMVRPFWVDRGYTNEEIGFVSITLGTALSIAGALAGGWFIQRRGVWSALLWLGLAQIVSNFGYVAIAAWTLPRESIYVASVIESFTQGLGTAAFLSFLTRACDRHNAATQYAFLAAAFSLSRDVAGAFSGFGVEALGYHGYFLLTAFLAVPGMLLLPLVRGRIRDTRA